MATHDDDATVVRCSSPCEVMSLASEGDGRLREWDDSDGSSFCSSVDVLSDSVHVLTPDRSPSPAPLREPGAAVLELEPEDALPRHQRHRALALLLLGPDGAHAVNNIARPPTMPKGKKGQRPSQAPRYSNCPSRDAGRKGAMQRSIRMSQRRESARHTPKPHFAGPRM
eukprot:GGOE01009230.1.p2 GENE.GGOE01009230.1~~GGOE01009230.1.p2  ORF type:complete len:184 (-),score=26.96 GGOE01009230.1:755-1261(-)